MSLFSLTVVDIDRTEYVSAVDQLRPSWKTGGQQALDVTFVTPPATAWEPQIGQQVALFDDIGDRLWSGIINTIGRSYDFEHPDSYNRFSCSCISYEERLGSRLIYPNGLGDFIFTEMTAGAIVEYVRVHWAAGDPIQAGTISAGITVDWPYVCDYISIKDLYDDLADRSSYIWFVDGDNKLHFVPELSSPVAFELTESSENFRKLNVNSSRYDFRDRQFVRIGSAAVTVETIMGESPSDGIFTTFFPIKSISYITTQEGTSATFAVAGSGTEAGFYYTPGSADIQVGTETDIEAIEVGYFQYGSDVVMAEDASTISARATIEGNSGIVEAISEETDITTIAAGEARAAGLLATYGAIPVEITFETRDSSLRIGHVIAADVQNRVTGYFRVSEIEAYIDSGTLWWYSIKAVEQSSTAFDYVAWWEQFRTGKAASSTLEVSSSESALTISTISTSQVIS